MNKTTAQLVEWVSTLVAATDPIVYAENGPAIRGAERALTNRGLDLSEHLRGGGYDWQSLISALGVEPRDYFDYHGWPWGGAK